MNTRPRHSTPHHHGRRSLFPEAPLLLPRPLPRARERTPGASTRCSAPLQICGRVSDIRPLETLTSWSKKPLSNINLLAFCRQRPPGPPLKSSGQKVRYQAKIEAKNYILCGRDTPRIYVDNADTLSRLCSNPTSEQKPPTYSGETSRFATQAPEPLLL